MIRAWGGVYRERGDNISATCPLAPWTHAKGTDRNPSISIKIAPGVKSPCKCWACGFEGTLQQLGEELVERGGSEYAPLLDRIKETEGKGVASGDWGFDLAHRHGEAIRPGVDEYPDDLVMREEEYAEYKGRVPIYAKDRGLSLTTCRCWELGHDRVRKRLLFPVRDWRGRLVGVSGRSYFDGCESCMAPVSKDYGICRSCGTVIQGKYLHTLGYQKGAVLYGEHKIDRDWPVGVLVEGNLDAIKLWQYGFRNVVASFGSGVSDGQLRRLAYFFKRLVVMGDGDKAGEKMANAVSSSLSDLMPVDIVRLPAGVDPGGMTVYDADFFLSGLSEPVDRGVLRFV